MTSPGKPIGSRLLAKTLTFTQARNSVLTSEAIVSIRCSQLSSSKSS
jgi:hypothetical protein